MHNLIGELTKILKDAKVQKVIADVEKQTGKTPQEIIIAIVTHLPQIAVLFAAKDWVGMVALIISFFAAPTAPAAPPIV